MESYSVRFKRLRLLTTGRLLVTAILLFCAQFVFPESRFFFYKLIVSIIGLSMFYVAWLVTGKRLKELAVLQIFFDLVLESVLIHGTGGPESVFASIYVLSILSAGCILSPVSSLWMAGVSSVLFAGVAGADLLLSKASASAAVQEGWSSWAARQDWVYLFYAVYVRVTVCLMVGYLTYYFAGKIRSLEDRMKFRERCALLGELMSDIAHEIRNPLASVSGSIELLTDELESQLNQNQKKIMSRVVNESERIKRMFNRLLDYARIPKLKRETVELAPFLDDILFLSQHQDGFDSKVSVDRRYGGKHIKAVMDVEYMKQAVLNILMNAHQAMENGGGQVRIDCRNLRDEIEIAIEDNGRGMNRKELASLFAPFNTGRREGTGLGMAQAQKVVNEHGGRILVQSKRNHGTRVCIYLPQD